MGFYLACRTMVSNLSVMCKPFCFLVGARSASSFNHIDSSFGATIIVKLHKQYWHSRLNAAGRTAGSLYFYGLPAV